MLRGFSGGTLSILILFFLGEHSHHLWIMAPFGASCVLLYAVPQSPLAQPRNVIFGHGISAAIGLCIAMYFPLSIFSTAIAVGLAIASMQYFRCVHPPAGANPLLILLTAQAVEYDWSFLLFPVLSGAISLVAVAYAVNNFGKNQQWPEYGLGILDRRAKNQDIP
ncbi:HPP family protein [Acinetobacter pragensis]|nr:HPP family protein [Acinetobacter pragensis]